MLWLNIKRNKSHIDVYIDGTKRLTISLSEQNRGNSAILNFDADSNVKIKVMKDTENMENEEIDENFGNKSIFNV